MEVRPIDVLRNLENHGDYWNIENYKMTKAEADVVIEALLLIIEKEKDDNVNS